MLSGWVLGVGLLVRNLSSGDQRYVGGPGKTSTSSRTYPRRNTHLSIADTSVFVHAMMTFSGRYFSNHAGVWGNLSGTLSRIESIQTYTPQQKV